MTSLEQDLVQAVKTGLHAAVKDKLCSYNSPLDKMLAGVVEQQAPELRTLLIDGIKSALADGLFRHQIAEALRTKLAKVLIDRFGGELEKQVNQLKSDPATRARITLAIEEIVRQKA